MGNAARRASNGRRPPTPTSDLGDEVDFRPSPAETDALLSDKCEGLHLPPPPLLSFSSCLAFRRSLAAAVPRLGPAHPTDSGWRMHALQVCGGAQPGSPLH